MEAAAEMSEIDVLLFESYSFSKVIFNARKIRSAGTVLFFRDTFAQERGHWDSARQKNIMRLASWINPGAQTRAIRIGDIAEYLFGVSRDAVKLISEKRDDIRRTEAYRLLDGVVQSESIVKFYQRWLARKIPYRYAFIKFYEKLKNESVSVAAVSDGSMECFGEIHPLLRNAGDGGGLNHSGLLVRLSNALRVCGWRLVSLSLPFMLFLRHIRGGWISSRRGSYALALPVVYGVFEPDKADMDALRARHGDSRAHGRGFQRDGMSRELESQDFGLYRRGFRPGEIVHVFGDWKLPPEKRKEFEDEMKERGYHYADKRKYGVNLALLKFTFVCSWRIARNLLLPPGSSWLSATMSQATAKALYRYILKQYEMENVKYNVELVRNEYNEGHILETIATGRNGRKRIGIVHASTISHQPENSFVHLDRMMTLCAIYTRTFAPSWSDLKLEKTGRHTVDRLIEEMERSEKIASDIHRLYGKRKWVVTILLPGVSSLCKLEQWDRMFEALMDFRRHRMDCHVFIRFRNLADVGRVEYARRFFDLPDMDARFLIDHETFTTHQLVTASALVIAANSSWGINEASIAGARVFTFSFLGMECCSYGEYGADFVLESAGDLLGALRGLESGFEGFDCDWERLRMDSDYQHDGRNAERLARVLRRETNAFRERT